jgi:hypothetical protein
MSCANGNCGCAPACDLGCGCEEGFRFWFGAEYLMWWIKDNPLPTPLLSTGPLGTPGAGVVLGGGSMEAGLRHGGRFTFGTWLDSSQKVGFEGNYFFLAREAASQTVSSTGLPGSTTLGLPFIDTATGAPGFAGLAVPGLGGDTTTVSVSTFLQGAEGNFLFNVKSGPSFRLGLLAGFRYLDLNERLNLINNSPGLIPTEPFLNFQDEFRTRNQFYGGQLGVRADATAGKFFANLAAKVALGDMRQEIDVSGRFVSMPFGGGATTVTPGGAFTAPTNIGSHAHDRLAWVPEVTANVGVNLTDNVSAFVGYNFLWVSDVVRPGSQIDPFFGAGRPIVPFSQDTFWAQGINFGVLVRF